MKTLTNIPHLILKYAAYRFQKYLSHYFVPVIAGISFVFINTGYEQIKADIEMERKCN